MIIYLGCTPQQYYTLKNFSNNPCIIVDKNKNYKTSENIKFINESIFSIEKIFQKLKQTKIETDVLIQPVADYAIPSALRLNKLLGITFYDFSFLADKTKTLKFLNYNKIKTISVVDHNTLSRNKKYIINKNKNGHESIDVKFLENSDGCSIIRNDSIVTEYIDGHLINVDLTIFDHGSQIKVDDVYLRVNDNNFRTVLTFNSRSDLLDPSYKKHLLKNLQNGLNGYVGRLTLDLILSDDGYFVLEMSPHHHKPWLTQISHCFGQKEPKSCCQVTVFSNDTYDWDSEVNTSNLICSISNENATVGRLETKIYWA